MAKSWGKIKKELEQHWMCEATRGRVSYFLTRYRQAHDQRGRVAVLIDGKEVLQSSDLETECENPGLWGRAEQQGMNPVMLAAYEKGQFHTSLFEESYQAYTSQSLQDNIQSVDPLVRLFTLFDRRIGRQQFKTLKNTLIGNAPFLQTFYAFRLQCEFPANTPASPKALPAEQLQKTMHIPAQPE